MTMADTLFPKKGEDALPQGVHRTVITSLDKAHAPPSIFSWPTPPFASYEAQQPWREPQECEIEGLNGAIRRCLLITMDVVKKVAVIQIASNKTPVSLPFSQFFRLHLKKLLHPQEIQTTEQFAELLGHRATVEYHLQLSDGEALSGLTIGCVDTDYGLYLFRPSATRDRLNVYSCHVKPTPASRWAARLETCWSSNKW